MDLGPGSSVDDEARFSSETGSFECHICFDLAQEPIVTLCGHLYCWPCLYQWIQIHSRFHECPVCKATVQEEKLVPIFGRGKSGSDPRSRSFLSGITIPNRPMGQRPETVTRVDISNFVRPNDLDALTGFMPMAAARFGHMTLSTLFGALPTILNLQVNLTLLLFWVERENRIVTMFSIELIFCFMYTRI
ncbi:hypothetical protein CASFOL_036125 [Castilleja foliolosa]|uniref:E3 ubiquitin-protein ligase RMA n=1 Tax=Castilleja foliolosa TaxID=1961234 RepID=A0ABD3BVG6_9LAMI